MTIATMKLIALHANNDDLLCTVSKHGQCGMGSYYLHHHYFVARQRLIARYKPATRIVDKIKR